MEANKSYKDIARQTVYVVSPRDFRKEVFFRAIDISIGLEFEKKVNGRTFCDFSGTLKPGF